ncbi:hypothetical protein R1flu_002235 [Riccia fluitans]|uniref:Uncharacterized protein n=1 Tax=Riccia fluitans TaxID=41844 RepID=A0ABD1Y5Q2_9MARC
MWRDYQYVFEGIATELSHRGSFIDGLDRSLWEDRPARYLLFIALCKAIWLERNKQTYAERERRIPLSNTVEMACEMANAQLHLDLEEAKLQSFYCLLTEWTPCSRNSSNEKFRTFACDSCTSAAEVVSRSYLVLGKTDLIFICGLDFEQGQPDPIAKLPVDFTNLSNQWLKPVAHQEIPVRILHQSMIMKERNLKAMYLILNMLGLKVDLNHTPPPSSPRLSHVHVDPGVAHLSVPERHVETHDPPLESPIVQRRGAIRGQRVKRKSLARQREMVAALREFTKVYKDAKQAKQNEERERTNLLSSLITLRKRVMFPE